MNMASASFLLTFSRALANVEPYEEFKFKRFKWCNRLKFLLKVIEARLVVFT
jgi:hypothetical protein